jgi:lipoprotein-anchoring transpeptidase ErfK/SrfK
MLELFLSLSLLCSGGECIPVAYGPDTIPGEYILTQHLVPIKNQSQYGKHWYQIGDDPQWGIHAYPNFGKWMISHGCLRIAKDDLHWLAAQSPTSIKIIGPNKYKKTSSRSL